jgi:hypothetical protein
VNAAAIVLDGPGSDVYSDAAATASALSNFDENAGAFTVRGGRDYQLIDGFLNRGEITVGGGTVLTSTSHYMQTAGRTRVDGTLESLTDTLLILEGELTGTGTVLGYVQAGGIVSPGASVGELTIDGDYVSDASAVHRIEIEGAGQNDVLTVTGDAAFAGVIEVIPLASFTPSAGDSFLVSTFGTRSGSFSGVVNCPWPGQCMDVAYVGDAVYLVVTGAPTTGVGDDEPGADDPPEVIAFAARSLTDGSVRFSLDLPEPADVGMELYDVRGRRVAVIRDGYESAGRHAFTWHGRGAHGGDVSSGVYFARTRVTTVDRTEVHTGKVVMLR